MKTTRRLLLLFTLLFLIFSAVVQGYDHFKTAVYCRAYEVNEMGDPNLLEKMWDAISGRLHIDKIYLETHRDLLIVDAKTLETAIAFFKGKGLEVGGGITYTIDEGNNFETFCYSNPEHRRKVKEIAEHTARFFDEFILDDFFFTSCKCDLCIEAKGDRSWTDFRLELMNEAATELVIDPAKTINPDVHVVIKYPNWYEHFQGLGFDLETGPLLFDGLYTGTETRDRSFNQHLQQYLGYAIFRYFENLKPGGNRGGWVDTAGTRYIDRYAEQLWLTLLAKAPEITLFDIRQLQSPVSDNLRPKWKGLFDFDEMKNPVGGSAVPVNMAQAAAHSLEIVDRVLGKLGNPVGVKSYKPFHSTGEDYAQTYFGMIGIPIDLVPEFPSNEPVVLLTETASFDPEIIHKIKTQLVRGGNVVVTSGFYRAMQGRGIEDIVELRVTDRKAVVKEFAVGWAPPVVIERDMIIPQMQYLTNDSWEIISALDDTNGWPVLHSAGYSTGTFFVWTMPDNFIDLYRLPPTALNRLRQTVAGHLPTLLEGPGEVSLFVYDNNSFVVHSFLDEEVTVKIIMHEKTAHLLDAASGDKVTGTMRRPPAFGTRRAGNETMVFDVIVAPHSFRAFTY
jgi:hypothetical protein